MPTNTMSNPKLARVSCLRYNPKLGASCPAPPPLCFYGTEKPEQFPAYCGPAGSRTPVQLCFHHNVNERTKQSYAFMSTVSKKEPPISERFSFTLFCLTRLSLSYRIAALHSSMRQAETAPSDWFFIFCTLL